jgi:hypothetical protein
MSAPYLEPAISISSSGHADGLGRRELCFDRETGAMLERLHVRPELAAFEAAIRERLEHLATLEDPRFARMWSAERIPGSGELTVLSEFVQGIRLADLFETALEETIVPGVDASLGFLLESLSAVGALHQSAGFPHGLIAPERIVFTGDGRLVFLDAAYAAVVDRLGLSRRRLWTELGIAAAPGAGPARLDTASDLSQTALVAVMLILGRRLEESDYPDNVPSLLMEVVEVAQIRGTAAFAGGLQRLLQRLLPLPGRRPYGTADEALTDLRQLLRKEIGSDVCQKALVDFISQLHPGQPSLALPGEELIDEGSDDLYGDESEESPDDQELIEFDLDLDAQVEPRSVSDRDDDDVYEISSDVLSQDLGDLGGASPISLLRPSRVEEPPVQHATPETPETAPPARPEIAEAAIFEAEAEASELAAIEPDVEPQPATPHETFVEPEPVAEVEVISYDTAPSEPNVIELREAPAAVSEEPEAIQALNASDGATSVQEDVETAAAVSEPTAQIPVLHETSIDVSLPAPAEDPSAVAEAPAPEVTPQDFVAPDASDVAEQTSAPPATPPQPASSKANHRRKRQQQKSARARKDKLRSTTGPKPETAAAQTPAAPVPPPASPSPAPSKSGWLIPPEKTAKFEASAPELIPTLQPATAPQVPSLAAAPAPPAFPTMPQPVVSYEQTPATPSPAAPAFPTLPVQGAPMPRFATPGPARPVGTPTPPAAVAAPAIVEPVTRLTTVKVKAEPPAGYVPTARAKRPRRDLGEPLEPVSHLPGAFRGPTFQEQEPARSFPWKLTIAAVVLVAGAIFVGRAFLPGGMLARRPAEAVPAILPPAEPEEPTATGPVAAGSGQIVIKTEPAGARVMLDGKPAGETPVTLNATAGRHVLTFLSSSGSVKRTVRVVAGKSVSLEVPIFSGWVSILAPFVVDVQEEGNSLGTTEQGRIMLAPGHHRLALTNGGLGYHAEEEVEVKAGEVSTVRVNPSGVMNFNAIPWAEVWSDGSKIGDTPIANHPLPLGSHEFVFKHPQFGERKVTATIRAGQPGAVAVDFTKPQQP